MIYSDMNQNALFMVDKMILLSLYPKGKKQTPNKYSQKDLVSPTAKIHT